MDCPISPCQEFPGHCWIETAGTTCSPFSTVPALTPKWCHGSALATMCWAYSCRYFEPREICHECVRTFDSSPFKKIFAEREGCLKQPCAKIVDGASAVVYRHREQVFSPFDCGVPADRRRRYNYWKGGGGGDVQDDSFEDLFFRKTVASPSVYLEHHRQDKASPNVVDGKSGLAPFRYRM